MDKQNTYWFKRRRYGWGWVPVAWQGWLATIFFIVLALGLGFMFDDSDNFWLFFVYFLPLLTTFIMIAHRKGPKPRWRWGATEDDDPQEDY